MARHILDREMAGITGEAARAAAMQRAYGYVAERLSLAVGTDGYTALLARALARAQGTHPVLLHMRRVDAEHIEMDATAGVSGFGALAVDQALETLFAAVADILADLIGADMASNLLARSDMKPTQDDRRPQ